MKHVNTWVQQATKVATAGALAPWQEAEGAGPRDRRPLRAPKSSLLGYMQKLFPMLHGRRWRDGGKECLTACQENIFHPDNCQALQVTAQGVRAVWEVFKTQLDKILSKLVWFHSSVWFQLICQNRWPPKAPSNLNWSIENWFSYASISMEKLLHKVICAGKCWFFFFLLSYSCNISLLATVSFMRCYQQQHNTA